MAGETGEDTEEVLLSRVVSHLTSEDFNDVWETILATTGDFMKEIIVNLSRYATAIHACYYRLGPLLKEEEEKKKYWEEV